MARSEKRLTELGTGNWNNRGIDNHIKRPAGVSSAGLKRMGMKRIEGVGQGKQSNLLEDMKYPKHCLVDNEYVYDGLAVSHVPRSRSVDPRLNAPAGIEASKTVHMHNHGALADKERDGPDGGRCPAWLVGAQTKRRCEDPGGHNPDPVKHDHVKPHDVRNRPMRRMFDNAPNAASRQNWNMQKQQLNTGPLCLEGMTQKDWKQIGKKVHMNECGDLIYNIGGTEDLRPACTHEYLNCDQPATLLTHYENDSRQLARFERDRTYHANPQLVESADMHHCMQGGSRTPSAWDESSYAASEARSFAEARAPSAPSRSARPVAERARSPPMSARSGAERPSPSVQSFRGSGRGGRGGERRPQTARDPERYDRNSLRSYRSSVASSYYSESEGGRRAKSQDRASRTESRFSDGGSVVSGVFSDPTRTVTAQALNEALQGALRPRSPRKGR